MADVSDVCSTLVGVIAGILYPTGTGNPSIAAVPVRVFQGWPVPQQLDADLAAGVAEISVFPGAQERNTTRYQQDWQVASVKTPTLSLAIAGQTVTVGGAAPSAGANNPHNVMVLANGLSYIYAVQPTDTLANIATALATMIVADIAGTTSSGPVLTLPNSARLQTARVGVSGTSVRELRRQEKLFQITIWVNGPASRDAVVQPLDAALSAMSFITLPDFTTGRLVYVRTLVSDQQEKTGLYRRDLFYTVEYGTTQSRTDEQVIAPLINVTPQVAGIAQQLNVTIYD